MAKFVSAVSATSNMLVASEGNGNVTQVLKRSDGSLLARFEYDAYGSPLVAAETYAAAMPLRFSSKWFDAETGLATGADWNVARLKRVTACAVLVAREPSRSSPSRATLAAARVAPRSARRSAAGDARR